MAYDYYCMGCGKKLNQGSALFDMQYLLTRNLEKKFQILKFRMTEAELKAMIMGSVPAENGYRSCVISFEAIMSFIGNYNNLNQGKEYTEKNAEGNTSSVYASDADIAGLTLAEIDAYIKNADETLSAKKEKKKDAFELGFALIEEEEEEQQEKKEEYKPSRAILALEAKDESNTDKAYTKVILRGDLEILRSLFLQGNVFTFKIKEENDLDNEGGNVLTGYSLAFADSGNFMTVSECRVCCACGVPVFKHAGTAKHQAVAFIGYQRSGKTSAILALAHYAVNHMGGDLSFLGDKNTAVWRGSETISSVASVELLDQSQRLKDDLAGYREGLAPPKTEANKRIDAYSVTLRLKNRIQNKQYLFTLTDLPGELCNEDGTVKMDQINNHFPVALTCDAFVACFDTCSIDPTGAGIATWIQNVCKWTEAFQKMRAEYNQVRTFVPTMLLFTKCPDLEDPNATKLAPKALLPIDQIYFLKEEKQYVANNGLYNRVRDEFETFGQLRMAYHAMMRCSPYGYNAPSVQDLQGPDKDKFTQQQPVPKNIDKLMRWLLSVAGCVPTEAEYRSSPLAPDSYRLNDYCISRPQLRSENPIVDRELEESLARCALFENPGKFDKEFVGKYDVKAQTFVVKLKSKAQPNSNAN